MSQGDYSKDQRGKLNQSVKILSYLFLQITELCLNYMTHDPNYNYDEDGDEKGMAHEEDEEEENDEYSDDDDLSWKVRRSAAKCLESIITTRHELLSEFYKILSPVLISRFKGKCQAF